MFFNAKVGSHTHRRGDHRRSLQALRAVQVLLAVPRPLGASSPCCHIRQKKQKHSTDACTWMRRSCLHGTCCALLSPRSATDRPVVANASSEKAVLARAASERRRDRRRKRGCRRRSRSSGRGKNRITSRRRIRSKSRSGKQEGGMEREKQQEQKSRSEKQGQEQERAEAGGGSRREQEQEQEWGAGTGCRREGSVRVVVAVAVLRVYRFRLARCVLPPGPSCTSIASRRHLPQFAYAARATQMRGSNVYAVHVFHVYASHVVHAVRPPQMS